MPATTGSKKKISKVRNDPNIKHKRSYKACFNCKSKKIKCDLGPPDEPHAPPCARCKREQKKCIFINFDWDQNFDCRDDSSPLIGKIGNNGKQSETDTLISNNSTIDKTKHSYGKNWNFGLTATQTALEFLTNTAGKVTKNEELTETETYNKLKEKSQLSLSDIEVQDYLSYESSKTFGNFGDNEELLRQLNEQNKSSLIRSNESVRPKNARILIGIEYIGEEKLLTEDEALKFIYMFFVTLHPFFPYIPLQLHNPEELIRYPILLCAILTISTRYNSFNDLGLDDDNQTPMRHIHVHEKLWIFCQEMISKTVWAEASTRSIGTVLAFLLFTEWNPRAIHWRMSDYANNDDCDKTSKMEETTENDKDDTMKKPLTGIETMRHSDRMAWMLIGTAVRLAQDMHFIDISSKIFVATHLSETFCAINIDQRSSLSESLETFDSYNNSKRYQNNEIEIINKNELLLLETILEPNDIKGRWLKFMKEFVRENEMSEKELLTEIETEFLSDEYALYYANKSSNEKISDKTWSNATNLLTNPMRFTKMQSARIELLKIISIAYKTLYCEKDNRVMMSSDQNHNLAVLSIFVPLIEGWYDNYCDLFNALDVTSDSKIKHEDTKKAYRLSLQIQRQSLICDFYYCQLYIYSLALQVDIKKNRLKLNEMTKSAKYVSKAYDAAKGIIRTTVTLKNMEVVKYIPIRWVSRIVSSVAFIVKCYLTISGLEMRSSSEISTIFSFSGISPDECLRLIKTSAFIMKDAAPDELHLCTRYSSVLLNLYLEMKLKTTKMRGAESTENNKNLNKNGNFNGQANESPKSSLSKTQTDNAMTSLDANKEPINLNDEEMTILTENNGSNPSTDVFNWFLTSGDIGLDFVDSWTEMIEQRYTQSSGEDSQMADINTIDHFIQNNGYDSDGNQYWI